MAKCDEGYLCDVCGEEVEGIVHSDLYLRFVIGEVDPEQLHTTRERHIACNPILAQFIQGLDQSFDEGLIPMGFGLGELDQEYVTERCNLVTRGWNRLQTIAASQDPPPIHDYPLEEVKTKWQ